MTVQKFITYNSLDIDGKVLSNEHKLELNVLEESGNYLIHRDILRHQSSQKQGTLSTKTRSEVRGGGAKPWQQKGTGRARAGSNRSPLWKGGGVIFGPEPHGYSHKLPRKMSKLARKSVILKKISDKQLMVLDKIEIDSNRTSDFINFLKNLNIFGKKTIILVDSFQENLILASRNIRNIYVENVKNVSVYDLIDSEIVLSDRESFDILLEVLS